MFFFFSILVVSLYYPVSYYIYAVVVVFIEGFCYPVFSVLIIRPMRVSITQVNDTVSALITLNYNSYRPTTVRHFLSQRFDMSVSNCIREQTTCVLYCVYGVFFIITQSWIITV